MVQRMRKKPVPGYEGIYEVSDTGRIWRVAGGRGTRAGEIARFPHTQGYLAVRLSRQNRKRGFLVHRVVALAFLGCPPSEKHVVDHKNGKKTDNRVTNLEWVTQRENQKRAHAERSWAKPIDLSMRQIRMVLRFHRDGLGFTKIARKTIVTMRTVRALIRVFREETRAALPGV